MRLPSAAISLRTPEYGPHARYQLIRREGLRHVVVEAGLQPLDDVVLALTRGEHDDREVTGERLAFGGYPDAEKLQELKSQGYDGVITLLNPSIPFEKVLLEREMENGKQVGIPIHSFPMLPWISENGDSLQGIERLVNNNPNTRGTTSTATSANTGWTSSARR